MLLFFWKMGEAETLHQVARNWSELLGFGAKMAPTMKHNTCKINFEGLILFTNRKMFIDELHSCYSRVSYICHFQTQNLANKENPTKYGKFFGGHVLYYRPRHGVGLQGVSLKTLRLKCCFEQSRLGTAKCSIVAFGLSAPC